MRELTAQSGNVNISAHEANVSQYETTASVEVNAAHVDHISQPFPCPDMWSLDFFLEVNCFCCNLLHDINFCFLKRSGERARVRLHFTSSSKIISVDILKCVKHRYFQIL